MTGPLFLAMALASVGAAITILVVSVVPARSRQDGVARALVAIEKRYSQQSTATAGKADPFASLPSWLQGMAARLSPSGMTDSLQRRLDLAGNPPRWTAERILAAKGLGMLVLAVIGGLYGLTGLGTALLYGAAGAGAGFFLPDLLLYNAGKKRQTQLQRALADALDMLTVCVEAGLGFDAALAQVARNTQGPLASEFARVLQEMQIGSSRSQALRGMVSRTTAPELRAFVSALVQAGELGISVARVLREQAKEMRIKRRQLAEEKAQKVPVKILFPLMGCLFPALFVVLMGPGAILIMNSVLAE